MFGSFTEDETRSLLLKPSSGKAEKPVQKKELQFGSVDFIAGKPLGGLHGESSRQLDSSKGSNGLLSSPMLKKDNEPKSVKVLTNELPGVLGTPKENGSVDSSTHGSSHINGVDEVKADDTDLISMHTSQNEDGLLNQFSSLKLQNPEENGVLSDSSVVVGDNDLQEASNGPVNSCRDISPRGLINSGNLCFLNATLQALLACSPFIQLLQELRTRKIPKVYFLDAMCFITSFCR